MDDIRAGPTIMNDPEASHEPERFPNRYTVIVQGHFHSQWRERFKPMVVELHPDGTTHLVGELEDQAALYGLIIKCRDMGLTLLAIRKI